MASLDKWAVGGADKRAVGSINDLGGKLTAIAGFTDGRTVWIGGDSAGVSGWDLTVRADKKVFQKGEFVFGYTSSFRMGQLIRFQFDPPVQASLDAFEYMATAFVDSLRVCLKAGGYARKENEREDAGTFMVGYRGRLFLVDSDYQVAESCDGYCACGSGGSVALGALYATREMEEPERRIRLALEAAERHSAGVRGPFVVVSVRLDKGGQE